MSIHWNQQNEPQNSLETPSENCSEQNYSHGEPSRTALLFCSPGCPLQLDATNYFLFGTSMEHIPNHKGIRFARVKNDEIPRMSLTSLRSCDNLFSL